MDTGSMCMMCNGASLDEVRFHIYDQVSQHGWTVVHVEEDPATTGWSYTIGLAELGHPELVIVGEQPELAGLLLNYLAEVVEAGTALSAGQQATVAGTLSVGFLEVHPQQYHYGLLAMWFDHYRSQGPLEAALDALQVVMPEHPYCQEHNHQHPQPPLLTTQDNVLAKPQSNRTAHGACYAYPLGRASRLR